MTKAMKRLMGAAMLMVILTGPAVAQDVGSALNRFGFDFFLQTHDKGNAAYSPLSIHAAFAMLTLGTGGATREESLEVLGLSESSLAGYQDFVNKLDPGPGKLSLASRLWPSTILSLKPGFVGSCEKVFGSGLQQLDYSKPEAARGVINGWTAEHTNDLIKELVPPGGVTSDTVLGLSNALYFKGSWQYPFREHDTHPGIFHAASGDKEVSFMRAVHYTEWAINEDYQAVSLPYEDSNLAMAVVMPYSQDSWQSVKERLGSKILPRLAASGRSVEDPVELLLPKFKVSASSKPLGILGKMGLNLMLGNQPDFSAMADGGGLTVDECFHQVVVAVDEKGTEAAAATAVLVLRGVPHTEHTITIDRPFFFVLYDQQSLAPLFLGQVVEL